MQKRTSPATPALGSLSPLGLVVGSPRPPASLQEEVCASGTQFPG